MSRRYLIDGYNLIHQIPDLKRWLGTDLERSRAGLLDQLAAFLAGRYETATVVFDGAGGGGHAASPHAKVKVLFSSGWEKADPLIKRIIDKNERNRSLLVVSSDQAIFQYARLCGVAAMRSQDFVQEMASSPEKNQKSPAANLESKYQRSLKPEEVEEWMRLFKNKNENGQ